MTSQKQDQGPRYAIYYTPALEDPLTQEASQWLGRCSFSGKEGAEQAEIDGLDGQQLQAYLASPKRYGFHGTLKAPFHLADGNTIEDLEAAFDAYCAQHGAFELPRLQLSQIGKFFALTPAGPSNKLDALARSLVMQFDEFRAELSQADIARRNPDRLSARQNANLLQWGYPHIFEDFRFHLTLTGQVEEEHKDVVRQELEKRFAKHLDAPRHVSELALFIEPSRGDPFTLHRLAKLQSPNTA